MQRDLDTQLTSCSLSSFPHGDNPLGIVTSHGCILLYLKGGIIDFGCFGNVTVLTLMVPRAWFGFLSTQFSPLSFFSFARLGVNLKASGC